ncbi:hypothetical protein ABIB00_007508 [Bradyrhizobium sp. LB14.3]
MRFLPPTKSLMHTEVLKKGATPEGVARQVREETSPRGPLGSGRSLFDR